MYRTLLAAALVPLALGARRRELFRSYSYSYSSDALTMAPTTQTMTPTASASLWEPSEAPTTVGTFGACPILQAVAAGSENCPLGSLTCPPDCLPRCDEPGLRTGDLCYVFVPDDRRPSDDVPSGEPSCEDEEIIADACEYIINDETRRRLQAPGGKFVVQQVVADATGAPTVTVTEAPTRADTYAPTRMTEAPSYAPTTDTYAPTFGSCPPIGDPDTCPSTRLLIQMGLPLCSEAGLAMFDYCITGPDICPDQPPTNCPAFQVARRLLKKIHGPVTRVVPSWAQRPYKKAGAGDEQRRRLAAPAEACAGGECYVAQVGATSVPSAAPTTSPTAAPTAGPTASPTAVPSAMPTNAPSAGPTASPTAAPTAGPTPGPTPRDCTKRGGKPSDTCECYYAAFGGCKISNAVDFPGCACKCTYKFLWRCTGKDVNCKDPESDACKNPDKSYWSCEQGGGDCDGYGIVLSGM